MPYSPSFATFEKDCGPDQERSLLFSLPCANPSRLWRPPSLPVLQKTSRFPADAGPGLPLPQGGGRRRTPAPLRGAEARLAPFPAAAAAERGLHRDCRAPPRSRLGGSTPSRAWPSAAGAGRPPGCWAFPTCRVQGGSCGLEAAGHLGQLRGSVRDWAAGEGTPRRGAGTQGGLAER